MDQPCPPPGCASTGAGRAPTTTTTARATPVGVALGAFALGSVAQGVPVVIVAVSLDRRGVAATWLAALAVARLAPYLLCSPLAGRVVGRWSPSRVLRGSLLARAGLLLALVVALGGGASPAVLVMTSFAVVAAGTPAYPAVMRLLHDQRAASLGERTVSLAGGIESASFWAGPALGGLLVGCSSVVLVVPVVALAIGASLVRPATAGGAARPSRTSTPTRCPEAVGGRGGTTRRPRRGVS